MKTCANLTMLFTELPFLERFGAAKSAGFDAVEVLFPYDVACLTCSICWGAIGCRWR